MTQLTATRPDVAEALPPVRRVRVAAVFVAALVAVVVLAVIHLTQGTSSVNAADLFRLAIGQGRTSRPTFWSHPGCHGCWPAYWLG